MTSLITESRRLLAAATEGPWIIAEGISAGKRIVHDPGGDSWFNVADTFDKPDAALIVHAVNALPQYIEAAERAAEVIRFLEHELGKSGYHYAITAEMTQKLSQFLQHESEAK